MKDDRRDSCITGATGGLGRALAADCAMRGWDLVLTDRDPERLSELSAGLEQSYGVATIWYAADLSDATGRDMLLHSLNRHAGRLDALINVAGLDHEGRLDAQSPTDLSSMIQVNVAALVTLTRIGHRAAQSRAAVRDPQRRESRVVLSDAAQRDLRRFQELRAQLYLGAAG